MNSLKRRALAGLVAAALACVPVAAAAQTQFGTGRDYGHCVAQCAQVMGFSGAMNPGMHQGFSYWCGGMTCCMH
jgi:hypothetical protein